MTDLNDGTTVPADNLYLGRLAAHLDGFATLLCGQGYAPATIRQKNELLADFSAWLAEHDVPLAVLAEAHADHSHQNAKTKKAEPFQAQPRFARNCCPTGVGKQGEKCR
jgi:hypothetical protein